MKTSGLILLLLGWLAPIMTLSAQFGSLHGKIVDENKVGIPFGNIVLIDSTLGMQIDGTASDFNGFFKFENIIPGIYNIQASYIGKVINVRSIIVDSGKITTLGTLQINTGATVILQELVVSEQRPLMDHGKPEVGYTITRHEIKNMPRQSRDKSSRQSKQTYSPTLQKPTVYNSPENFPNHQENKFHRPQNEPLSTFSIDVDRASYGLIRRDITARRLPQTGSVQIEEMINYFNFNYPNPDEGKPISIYTESGPCHWNPAHRVVMVGLQSTKIEITQLPPSNLVFLIDVSGSMNQSDKLPLVKQSLRLLVENLREEDRIAIVVYAGAAGLKLPATSGMYKEQIMQAIDVLQASGSTAGGQGIQLAHQIAQENYIEDGENRVILATDGDFNVGVSTESALQKLIEEKRESGVYLTVLGYGYGNFQAAKMKTLAKYGNGNYAYIDNLEEARKMLVKEMGATLQTVASDVKIQVEFNPATVQAYRLIGYEQRLLNAEDFNDDKKDAGEIGAGHSVTVLYEIIPAGVKSEFLPKKVDKLKYQGQMSANANEDWMTVKVRYKEPGLRKSQLIEQEVLPGQINGAGSEDYAFASAVAGFGMVLKGSEFAKHITLEAIAELASKNLGDDTEGYRAEFITLVQEANRLQTISTRR